MSFNRICVIVLDSVGVGELPDAASFGDVGANTLRHIAQTATGMKLPTMQQLGLGHIIDIPGIPPAAAPLGYYGKMAELSVGKDTMTGHWELMGLTVSTPFHTYPDGFPDDLLRRFEQATGRPVIGNKPASGTAIIEELGEQQMATGAWIVYTSADSVLQIAAHEDVIPLDELYRACEEARRLTLGGECSVGRVIARPYVGAPGSFRRTANRRDYAVRPPERTALQALAEAGFDSIGVGKIGDIFCGEGLTASHPTKSNADGMAVTERLLRARFRGLLLVNLVDFDSLYGHRRDPHGYAGALEAFDQGLPALMDALGDDDLLIITADHGNDPTFPGTDHTREYVPLLVWSPAFTQSGSLGARRTFADVAATITDNFGIDYPSAGASFLSELGHHHLNEE